ncbi:MAG: ABC transporter ATP-binding protein, partial [Candidatus Falkowbacteria bacterium]|nr:ABC transporter ATP-binding protein [Candidatus Falkowbacteria bacterium]
SHRPIKVIVILTIVLEIVKLVGPYILKLIIDEITNFNRENILSIIYLIILMFAVNQIVTFFDYLVDKKIIKIHSDAIKYLSVSSFTKLLFLPLSYHEKENTGNKVTKIEKGLDKTGDLIGFFSWEIIPTIFQSFFTAIFLLIVDYRFALVYFIVMPIFFYLTLRVNVLVQPNRKQRYADYEKASGILGQAIININTVKSFVQESQERAKYKKVRENIWHNEVFEYYTIFGFNIKRSFLLDLGRIIILLLGVYFVWIHSITIGTLVFVYTISEKALISLFRFSRVYDRIMEGSEAINRLYNLNKEQSEINNPQAGVKPKTIIGKVEFHKVNFSYNQGGKRVLKNINLKIPAGSITALVGPSGGGKTTVARMIYRHYDPQSGSVTLDGIDLRNYDLYAFRKVIAIVPQEVEIFNESVKKNIAYAAAGTSEQEIIAAAKIANAHEFIDKLPKRYNTEVGERGIKLSGGQRQRIGIARAILANPRILIFDEATSNLDSYSEELIQEAIDKIKEGRTIIIIAHRLSTIKKADKIIVLENGEVVEEGSHYELVQIEGGLYAKLIDLQRMGDVE